MLLDRLRDRSQFLLEILLTIQTIPDPYLLQSYENGQYSVYWTIDEWQFILVSPYDYETSLRLAGDLEYIKAL